MRVCFICGSLDPGRDGVGDYVRRLAAELIRQGHPATAIALNDASFQGVGEETQRDEDTIVATLRLARSAEWSSRVELARNWVEKFGPDWVSLHYVPYSFDGRGLPFGLATRIQAIGRGYRLQVMFHETWIGFTRIAPFKHRLVGFVQRHILCGLLRRLRPAVIHISNRLYQLELEDNGFQGVILPLFSSIPVGQTDGRWMQAQLAGLGIAPGERSRWVLLGVFGSVHSGFSPLALLAEQLALAEAQGRRVAFLGMGKGGPHVASLWAEINKTFETRLVAHHFGEQPVSQVSEYLQALDWAIATVPRQFLDKSSTIAAMHAHGRPILVPQSVDLPEYRERLERFERERPPASPRAYEVSEVAAQFLSALKTGGPDGPAPITIALVSTGLGVVRRGFEVATLAWARALRADGRLQVQLYSGGHTPESTRLPCLTQNSLLVRCARYFRLLQDGARLQQRTFAPALRRVLRQKRPDFLWLQEWTLAREIQTWLRREKLPTRVIFCNGAPVGAAMCRDFDFVMDLHAGALADSLAAGISRERLALLPHPCVTTPWAAGQAEARERLGVPPKSWVVACVAAWNRHHKRIHVLIEAASQAGVPALHLILCGQPEREAAGLKALAEQLMPGRTTWLTLPPEELPAVYAAADLFVLPSLTEGLGAVFIEAGCAGVPVLAHRMAATEFIFGADYPGLMDMSSTAQLANRLGQAHHRPDELRAALPQADLMSRFSPAALAAAMHDFLVKISPRSA